MYLKQLELQGFKSFPEKVRLPFRPGVTVVVGPNGSGKSNLSDAVRWVLGEQRAKSLRGDKMEDVIFAGTANRKALGFAEVALVLDNSDHAIGLDFAEVRVSRQVFRSGESRYLINGVPCRLKDVQALFMDTGVGQEGYAIIGQGNIDAILSSKSEDRRRLFEEAAGIVKFRTRKEEAEEKLRRERENLTRAEDIREELEKRLLPLQQESERAKIYLSYRQRLKEAELDLFGRRMQDGKAQSKGLKEKQAIAQEQWAKAKADQAAQQERLSQLEEIDRQQESARASLLLEMRQKESEAGEKKSRAQRDLATAQQQEKERERLWQEAEREEAEAAQRQEQSRSYASRLSMLQQQQKELAKRRIQVEEGLAVHGGVLTESESAMQQDQKDLILLLQQIAQEKSSLERLEEDKNQIIQRRNEVKTAFAAAQSRKQAEELHYQVLCKEQAEKRQQQEKTAQALADLTAQLSSLQAKEQLASKELQEKTRDFHTSRSRYLVLKEMQKEYEGFSKSVKAILIQKDQGGLSGICGAASEVVQVPKGLETAMETALGSAMQQIITETAQDAKRAIAYLKHTGQGRATFLPLDILRGREMTDRAKILAFEGVVGIAKDLVTYDAKYEGVMAYLLGRTVVVETMDTAIRLGKETGYRYRLVTRDGDVMSPAGVMTGGSAKKTTNVFGRTREIATLETTLKQLQSSRRTGEITLETLRQQMQQMQQNRDALEESKTALQLDQEKAKQQLSVSQEKQVLMDQEIASLQEEEGKLMEQEKETDSKQQTKSQALAQMEAAARQMEAKVTQGQKNLAAEKAARENAMEALTEIKISQGKLEQEMAQAKAWQEETNKLHQKGAERAAQKRAEANRLAQEAANHRQESQALEAEAEKRTQQAADLFQKQKALEKELSLREEEKKACRQAQQDAMEIGHELQRELDRLSDRLERLAQEEAQMCQDMWQTYEVTPGQALSWIHPELSLAQREKERRLVKEEMRRMGDVNLQAVEEYRLVKEQYDFRTAQRDDILRAEADLQGVITGLQEKMEQQFRAQFAKMNENFSACFRELFGGGTAFLRLSDESHSLEGGIEIIARPPGKTLQNMMLLSGGERALTAIAILFAIL